MRGTTRTLSLIIFIVFPTTILVEGQLQRLKYVNTGANPGETVHFTGNTNETDLRNTKSKFARADRICAHGMWSLYSTQDWGEGQEDSTNVVTIRSSDIGACTTPTQVPNLKGVRSVRPLGRANIQEDGIRIFSLPDFLGGLWAPNLPGTPIPVTGVTLGSIAVTGNKTWVICGDNDGSCVNGVCVNGKRFGNMFLQRNTASDTSLGTGTSWPKIVRQIISVTLDECLEFPSPTPPPSGSSGGSDLTIYSSSPSPPGNSG